MIVNYWVLSFANIWLFVIGELIGGFYSAFVLIGNHEREHKFPSTVKMTFIDHQIITCRNYEKFGIFWLIMMGGMQYQTEHHLFPQILFYNLPEAARIIKS
jgi:fatty acid desaturase